MSFWYKGNYFKGVDACYKGGGDGNVFKWDDEYIQICYATCEEK